MADHVNAPQIDRRTAQVAAIMLDVRMGGRYVPRETFRMVTPPKPGQAAAVARAIGRACGQAITPAEIAAAHRLLRSTVPTHEIRRVTEEV
jgi:hypothetical protein